MFDISWQFRRNWFIFYTRNVSKSHRFPTKLKKKMYPDGDPAHHNFFQIFPCSIYSENLMKSVHRSVRNIATMHGFPLYKFGKKSKPCILTVIRNINKQFTNDQYMTYPGNFMERWQTVRQTNGGDHISWAVGGSIDGYCIDLQIY